MASVQGVLLLLLAAALLLRRGGCWTSPEETRVLHDVFVTCGGQWWTWKNDSLPQWSFSSEGVPETDPCGAAGLVWEGLECEPSGAECASSSVLCHVTVIDLTDYNVTGYLHPSVGNLSHLKELTLWENRMTGTIPEEIGNLRNLTKLDLEDNAYEGSLPHALYNLTNMEMIYLSENLLTGTISSSHLAQFSKIRFLFMAENIFTGTLPSMESMSSLVYLSFQSNSLTGTIHSSGLGELQNLLLYTVSGNDLNGTIPLELGVMTSLLYLSVGLNDLSGTIPPSLQSMHNLRFLGLHANSLAGTLPTQFTTLSNLRNLWLHENMLTGHLPTKGELLGKLQTFFAFDNLLTGTLPVELGVLPNVFDIRIQNNFITGSMPSSVGQMTHVERFDVSGNYLTGVLPSEIGDLYSLIDLELHNNNFNGAIPLTIGKLYHLEDLELSNNLFSSIPVEFGNLTNLKKAFIQNNELKGDISDIFWQADVMALKHLDFSGNLLEGSVPATLFHAPNIQTVALSINCFSGEIPHTICSAANLNVISMDGVAAANDCEWTSIDIPLWRVSVPLEGSIPPCVWSMTNLTVLHLSGNGLTGKIGSFSNSSSMLNMSLAHNRLSGTIPRLLQENPHLLEMDLSYNRFTGEYQHGSPGPKESVILQVNRLSGKLEQSSLELVKRLNMLIDNRFDCQDIPSSDENFHDYSCESIDLDKSLYTMSFVVCFLVGIFLLVKGYDTWRSAKGKSQHVGIETEPYAVQRWMAILVNGSVYFSCLDNLASLPAEHVLSKLSIFSEELYSILKGCIALCFASAIMNIPLYVLKILDNGEADSRYSTYTHMYSWLFSAAYVSGLLPAIMLLLTWTVFMLLLVFFIWKFSKKYGDLFFEKFTSSSTSKASNESIKIFGAIFSNGVINVVANGIYIYLVSQNISRLILVLIQVMMAIWNIFASVVILPTLSKPITNFEKCIKTRLFMFISNSMVIPCLVAMRISPSCFETLFRKPDEISSVYSYEDCTNSVLMLSSGIFVCEEYGQFTVDVPPLTPPFSYNYDCSSVILSAYIPVYIYMYALLALSPLIVALVGVSIKYDWIPLWLRVRLPGILWPYNWSVEGGRKREKTISMTETSSAMRVRTTSDMSTESDNESDQGQLSQEAEPKLMINVIPIVTLLMHNMYILSTFGLCSPYLAVIIVICNSCHITMWKIMLGRFVTCRIMIYADFENKNGDNLSRGRSMTQDEFLEFNIIDMMRKDVYNSDMALMALSEQLADVKGIFAICIWPILISSSFFFVLLSLDIAGDKVTWAGGLWVPVVLCLVPLLIVWMGIYMLKKKRAINSTESDFSSFRPSESSSVELTTVKNVLHHEDDRGHEP